MHNEIESVTVNTGAGKEATSAKIRLFVIIRPEKRHCICLPLITYSGQDTCKGGVEADNYAVLYSGETPVTFKGERKKDMARSIRMIPSKTRHNLDDRSRLRYAEPFTVEYNVKVWFIGKFCQDSERQLLKDYNRVNPPLGC